MTLEGKNPAQSDIAPSAILAWNFTFSSLSIPIFGKKTWWPYCDPNWSPPMSVCDTCATPLGVLMSDSYVFSLRKFPSMAEWDGWRTGPWLERHTIHAPGRLWMGSVSRQRQRPTSMLCSCVSNTHTHTTLGVFSFLCVEHIWTLHIFLGWLNMFLRNNCVWTKYLESNCVLTIGFQTLPFITICFLSERHTFFILDHSIKVVSGLSLGLI
jgi:hypothetical protein